MTESGSSLLGKKVEMGISADGIRCLLTKSSRQAVENMAMTTDMTINCLPVIFSPKNQDLC
jgi:hypothetical protein